MDVVHPRCAGIDISKRDAKVCVRIQGQGNRRSTSTVTTWGAMTGQILALREEAKKSLGPRFSLQRFHDALLAHGAPPVALIHDRVLRDLDPRARELLAAVGLQDFRDTLAAELSYGRKRALEIATTLALDPELMLLDEPTAGMGHEDVDRIASLIQRVSKDRTVLMVEHNLGVVASLSQRITVLARGEVIAEGDYLTVSKDRAVVAAYLGTDHA